MKALALCLTLLGGMSWAMADESIATLSAKADWSCVDFHAIGVCRRNTPPFAGVKVRYWQPVLLVETLKHSGESGITEFKAMVGEMTPAGPDSGMAPSGSGGGGQGDTTSLQMNEAHVFGFPLSDAFSLAVETPCEGPADIGGMVSYLSEQDKEEWRSGRSEKNNPPAVLGEKVAPMCDRYGSLLPGMCLGTWGPMYPRVGFVAQADDIMSSAVSAFRAVDVASFKPQPPHRVLSPVLFWPNARSDRMQLVSPSPGRCMAVGENPALWEEGKRATDGRYVWIYWRKKECCLF